MEGGKTTGKQNNKQSARCPQLGDALTTPFSGRNVSTNAMAGANDGREGETWYSSNDLSRSTTKMPSEEFWREIPVAIFLSVGGESACYKSTSDGFNLHLAPADLPFYNR
jgi:hypothetical protein